MEGQVQIGRKILLKSDVPLNGQVGFTKIRARVEIKLGSVSDRIHEKISGTLLVESEVLKVDVRFYRRLLESARGLHREIGDAVGRQTAGLQAREAGEIEVASGKIQAKLSLRLTEVWSAKVRQAYGRAPGKWSIVGTGIDVVELQLIIGEAEITLQQRNGHAVGYAIFNFEVTIAVRVGARARYIGGDIQGAGIGTGNSGQLCPLRHVRLEPVKLQSQGSGLRKSASREGSAGVEAHRGVAMNERAVVRGEMTAGILKGRREGIPVNRTRSDVFGRRQDRVKIVDFEISVDGKRGESAEIGRASC